MANDVSFVKIVEMTERKDPETGEIRLTGVIEEVLPRQHNINLSRQNADFLNRFRAFQGKTVILQTREGVFNGRSFLSLAGAMIVPVDSASIPTTAIPSEAPNDSTEQKPPQRQLFGAGAKA